MAPLCCCLLRARRLLFFFFFFFFAVAVVLFSSVSVAQIPGFQSIDCGGSGNYTDEVGLEWTGDEAYVGGGAGATASISSMSGQGRRPYRTVRYFPADGRKYCYRVSVKARTRYLVRASFLYGNFDGSRVFPEFDLLDLNGFPGSGWACSYLAEIEDDAAATARRFKLYIPGLAEVSKPTVDIGENAPGKYRVYQPGYDNISLPFVLPFAFRKTDDSARGPILNAMEIYSYIPILPASPDAVAMDALAARYQQQQHSWAREGGDPCVPAPWSWLTCTSSRVIAIRLDNNMLTGPIPDLSACTNLTVIHLENNQLEGSVPSYLSGLPKLSELYLENNRLSGVIPRALLSRTIVFKYSGNKHLRVGKQEEEERNVIIGICALMGIGLLLAAALCYAYNVRVSGRKQLQGASAGGNSKSKSIVVSAEQKKKATPVAGGGGGGIDNMMAAMAARGPLEFEVRELEEATSKFARKIGSGGFGVVYYGRLGDGREIAVKVASSNESIQGKKQLANEVALLSRIHHRNLVAFLGYCWERDSSSYMLVYEYMHNGSLKEQLQMMSMSWLRRLQVAEDAAKGIEYLHCGCTPAIIHRDIKTSNILLDAHMRAKVSDLGLSKSNKATNSTTNTITTHVRGTLGYLDPHYYVSQQLTHKSDLYSFGIILLELISGRPPILLTPGAGAMASLGPWAKSHYESGDIEAIVDPSLRGRYRDVHSVWKVAETAVRCIDADPRGRPSMPEVVKDIQEAIALEMPSSESERPAASFFSPGAGAAGARSSATVRSHDLVMDNLMYDSSFCDSLNLPRTPR
uniref:non-specific serine/threonine protein kinase n=1 Tax=Oryza barthii TaxID=65489 RepID=A0A0D3EZC6_9ORYZ